MNTFSKEWNTAPSPQPFADTYTRALNRELNSVSSLTRLSYPQIAECTQAALPHFMSSSP